MHRTSSFLSVAVAGTVLLALVALQIGGGPRTAAQAPAAMPQDLPLRSTPFARGDLARGDNALTDAAVALSVEASNQAAAYIGYPKPMHPSEAGAVSVAIRNQGNTTWDAGGPKPVELSYHVYDGAGQLIGWDGLRTALPYDIPPGGADVISMRLNTPAKTGTYTIKPDLIREGVAWFSAAGAAPGAFKLRVTADIDAEYGSTTAPASIVPGGEVPVEVHLKNSGPRAWPAGGEHPLRLSYHWFDGSSNTVVWDGARAILPRDVAPGDELSLTVYVRAPPREGAYVIAWDMVQEGIGWLSRSAVPMKEQWVVVQNGVTLYGKGWGHGIGLSQWGAQGWAEGAMGVRLTGEEIVAKYFPGAQLSTQPITQPFRVLLSAPSTGCIGRTIWNIAHMRSAGGMRLVNDADPSVVYLDAAPGQSVRFSVYRGSVLVAVDEWSGHVLFAGEDNSLTLVPKQWWDPISISEKGLAYRGNVLVQVRDDANLRVVNYVSSDDYMRGALPGEMPSDWEMEALRAQAITARTYAAWRQATGGDRTWDVRDDTADQCYLGNSFETPRAAAAVASTTGLILTYAGMPIRALYSSADGGITENVGCVLEAEKVGITWQCADGWPYLAVIDDPADLVAYDARSGNLHDDLWARYFSGNEIRRQIIEDYGVDIGYYVSIEFNMSPGGRPISVHVRGTDARVDLKGDRFLRQTLGLKSTLVRTLPF